MTARQERRNVDRETRHGYPSGVVRFSLTAQSPAVLTPALPGCPFGLAGAPSNFMEPAMALTPRVFRLRTQAFVSQGFRCFYCRLEMWSGDVDAYAKRWGLTGAQSVGLECTAEHLIARKDGGQDTAENVVAACLTCNRRRHRWMPNAHWSVYAAAVAVQMAKGHWRKRALLKRLKAPA